ncbi:hypothetical protein Vca1114GL_00130 [Vibrio campbellii]|uniref:hypothetical protein n=1 Tax=Vibrio campbellii TaxID=680 RepID=UPI00097FB4BD|nr:hypothetical protein [Vibrio campbellii]AQM66653.1 hypothetical protein Vca1114GL_00130 [Vibrio campbellii]
MPVEVDGIKYQTEEEFFARHLDGKRNKSSDWAEEYTEAFLAAIDCPIIHKVDGNPAYEKLEPGLLTPDFVIFSEKLGENDPDVFYVDVQEVTGGPWDLKGKGNPIVGTPNPLREGMLKTKEDRNHVQRVMINEDNPKVLKAIFNPLKEKSKKYGTKKRQSSKFGLVSVQGGIQDIAYETHFQKLLWHSMEVVINFMKSNGYTINDIHKFMDLRLEIMGHKQEGVVPLFLPFPDEKWCFWAILGSKSYQGLCLLIVNTVALDELKGSAEYDWLLSFTKGQNFMFSERLNQILSKK